MAFVFDETNPTDSFLIPNAPLNHRNSRLAIKNSVDVEHESTNGRHKFGRGNLAARDAITDWEIGSLWFRTDTTPAYLEVCIDDTAGPPRIWESVDARAPTSTHTDVQSSYTVGQYATFDVITTGAGATRTCAIDLDLSPAKFVTIIADTIISNPTAAVPVLDGSTTVHLDLLMDGLGPWAITWGTNYWTSEGATPLVGLGINERTEIFITQMENEKWLVTTQPNVKQIGT